MCGQEQARASSEERPASPRRDALATIIAVLLAVLVFATAVAVDPRAEAAFYAPKRFISLGGAALLSIILLAGASGARSPAASGHRLRGSGGALIWLLLVGVTGALISVALSPRRILAMDSLRAGALIALMLPIGASRALDHPRGALWVWALTAAGLLNGAAFALQRHGMFPLLDAQAIAGRAGTGGFAGNEGQLAAELALTTLLVLGHASARRNRMARIALAIVGACLAAFLLACASLTATLAVATGGAVFIAVRFGRRAALPVAVFALLAMVVATAVFAPLRTRAEEAAQAIRSGDWNRATTSRLAPWAAAAALVAQRPLVGFGPGTFGSEYVGARLQAELFLHKRLLIPKITATFDSAHNEYLQAAAELGLVTTAAVVAAIALLVAGLARGCVRSELCRAHDVALLLPAIIAGLVLALAWFPLRQPAACMTLLLVCGRAGRLVAPRLLPAGGVNRGLRVGLAALLALAFLPELDRYRAERKLYAGTTAVRSALLAERSGARSRELLALGRQTPAAVGPHLPGNPGPLLTAGAALLAARDPAAALEIYGHALAEGERAETVLNLGRAYAMLDHRPEALAAFVRAVWVNPELLADCPAAARPLVSMEIYRLTALLEQGRLKSPPPLPLHTGAAVARPRREQSSDSRGQ
ncbi:MAG: O-antigen ligase family protein [Candidatus Schekmanbacteria bacterium]|nr:O-antigen ligase family protein [Candidatus Schekmanbacteria bacterium]